MAEKEFTRNDGVSEPSEFCYRLAAAIAEMPNPVKDTKAYNYKYETLDQVMDIVQGKLMFHGLYVTQGIKYGNEHYELVTTVRDMYDPEIFHVMDARPLKLVGDPQKDGSAETYARRYSLKTIFGLVGGDDDGAAASEPRKMPKQQGKSEYQLLCSALNEYCETTGEDKGTAWKKFNHGRKASDFEKDSELSKATREDIEKATSKASKL